MTINIEEKVREFMLEEFFDIGFDDSVENTDSLTENGFLDSLSILRLISFFDEEFDVLPEEDELDIDKIDTIEKISHFLAGKIKNGKENQ